MSKLGKAVMSLFLDKQARSALENARQSAKAAPQAHAPPQSGTSRESSQAEIKAQLDAKIAEVENRPAGGASPTRQDLINAARRVHAAKQEVLSDLSEEQRLKLQVLAMKAMMPGKPDGHSH